MLPRTIDEQYNLLLASDFQKAQSLLPIVIQSQLFNLQNKNIVDHWEVRGERGSFGR